MIQSLGSSDRKLHPLRMLILITATVVVIALMLWPENPVDHVDRGVVIVQGGAEPASKEITLPQSNPAGDEKRMQVVSDVKGVEAAVLRDYPFVKGIQVQCDAQTCFVVGQLGDISDEETAQSFDRLVDANLSTILARNGLLTTGPVIIDTLGGLNTGFRWELRR